MTVRGKCAFCGDEVVSEKIGFRDLCNRCDEGLHTCTQCQNYAPGKSNDCLEPQAELVRDKERNNLCDWFVFAGGDGGGDGSLSKNDADELLKKLLKQQH